MVAKGLFTPPSLGPTVETTAFSLASLSTIVVLLRYVSLRLEVAMRRLKCHRFYCRIWIVKKLKSYDYLIAGAVVSRNVPIIKSLTLSLTLSLSQSFWIKPTRH
jgi:hypothetical protein